jgi:hypothetical protein
MQERVQACTHQSLSACTSGTSGTSKPVLAKQARQARQQSTGRATQQHAATTQGQQEACSCRTLTLPTGGRTRALVLWDLENVGEVKQCRCADLHLLVRSLTAGAALCAPHIFPYPAPPSAQPAGSQWCHGTICGSPKQQKYSKVQNRGLAGLAACLRGAGQGGEGMALWHGMWGLAYACACA